MTAFTNKTALVTGAASGIGAACVAWMERQNLANFILVDLDIAKLERIGPDGRTARFGGDVADPALWAEIERLHATIDMAVLNAGIADAQPLVDLNFQAWRRVLSTNLDGMALALSFAMRAMRAAGSGAAVLTASTSGFKAEAGTAAYAASKAGVIQLAKVAAKEGAPMGIRVNAIAPGGVDTPIWDEMPVFADLVEQHGERAKAISAMGAMGTPLGRFARADEIAAQIGFLLSDDAATITGTALVTDSGYSL